MSLVSKDELLTTSMPHIGYVILKQFEATGGSQLSLTEITSNLKRKHITGYRPIMFALIFLHLAGIIEFRAPFVYKVHKSEVGAN
ncbi:MAG TPA: hypothetical protein DDX19_23980 [Rhodopirellula baltica]|uniref:Uncharacterized protein n=1 Tax=Rhodopirellula baltica (strain DSM 10527 / NCIMB 13988 / SH1) TaxID=243090 RepID=Q7UN65_RHOBA|nr:hypothetical protein [Rhodopirellula baltica]CAD75554.1 hypothetical protein-transmembrane prediction [Rhodopirellula baltica SH 1]HBE65757.1 hypothetical protein [Rhodopirellula baltica]